MLVSENSVECVSMIMGIRVLYLIIIIKFGDVINEPNVRELTQDTTREIQWRKTNCACAFYCVKGQYKVFQPITTSICRTCTVVIKIRITSGGF